MMDVSLDDIALCIDHTTGEELVEQLLVLLTAVSLLLYGNVIIFEPLKIFQESLLVPIEQVFFMLDFLHLLARALLLGGRLQQECSFALWCYYVWLSVNFLHEKELHRLNASANSGLMSTSYCYDYSNFFLRLVTARLIISWIYCWSFV